MRVWFLELDNINLMYSPYAYRILKKSMHKDHIPQKITNKPASAICLLGRTAGGWFFKQPWQDVIFWYKRRETFFGLDLVLIFGVAGKMTYLTKTVYVSQVVLCESSERK